MAGARWFSFFQFWVGEIVLSEEQVALGVRVYLSFDPEAK